MGSIKQLPREIVEKIAAGEVIERPASVVKELVENAIDAGATSIEIDVENGGKKLIRVADDGRGIEGEDLRLAFVSHATSKLSSVEELFAIRTMGFRGEALAAIAAVSQLSAVTRTRESDAAFRAECAGGPPEKIEQTSGAPGSVFEVRNLFFNIPARRKFLRSDSAEMARISDAVTEIALCHPETSFRLTHNTRLVFRTSATEDLRARIGDLIGASTADELIEIGYDDGFLRVHGYVGRPENALANSRAQYFFLNGRCIRDKLLIAAARQAHEGYIERGRFPRLFLYLTIDPAEVDVNVHPTKREVRFADGSRVYKAVREAVVEALSSAELTVGYEPPSGGKREPPSQERSEAVRRAVSEFFSRPQAPQKPLPGLSPRPFPDWSQRTRTGQSGRQPPFTTPVREVERADDAAGATGTPAPEGTGARKAIQIHSSYILYETETGFTVIDQHALHERILLEQIRSQLDAGKLPAQRLMHPLVFDVTSGEKERILNADDVLERLGFHVEAFGPTSVGVFTLPQMLRTEEAEATVRDIAQKTAEIGDDVKPTQVLERAIHSLACQAAVKAGQPLSQAEIDALLEHKEAVVNASRCAHGRPTALEFPLADLEKRFQRR